MSRVIYRALIGREDFAIGQGVVTQRRGDSSVNISQMELMFIFRTVAEIRALDYSKYVYVGLYNNGPIVNYYFDPDSLATDDGDATLKPDSLLTSQAGRYIKFVTTEEAVEETLCSLQIFDTIIASASDEETPLTVGGPKTTFRAPYGLNLENGYVRISLTNAPAGSALIVRLTVNGVDLFTTNVQIDAGSRTSVGSVVPAVIDPEMMIIPDDAEFLVYITQVGSTYAGSGLKVAVTGVKIP